MRIPAFPLLPAVAALTLTAALAACSSSSASAIAPQHPDMSGTWLLNDLASDDPSELFGQAARNPADPSLPGGNRQRVGVQASSILAAARVFRLTQSDSTVNIVLQDGTEFLFHTDGREVESRIEGLGNTTTKARWKGDKFEVERKLEGGTPRLTTTYELSEDGRQLFVKFKLSAPGRSIDFERVYEVSEG
ncbi:MAG: hypothetical protein JSV86_09100 [Gemmatimonadota bacterium]|nr:MAG: hypothetical protein JSV86_09100 [Gemmatimonadota bacterium]